MLDGILFFPVTPFNRNGAVNLPVLAEHIELGMASGPGGVFVACGAGEFHALEPVEYASVVKRAAQVVDNRVPLVAGAGGPIPIAKQFAHAAADSGADALLLLPPYLAAGPPRGVAAYVREVGAATTLPLIVYNRDNATFDPQTAADISRLPTVTGFKDGRGDLDSLKAIVAAVRDALDTDGSDKPFQFFNGTPTAEISVSAYRDIGVEAYSSAVYCFVPEISTAFYRAVTSADERSADRLLESFFRPLVALRDTVPGYAVSLIKAGLRLSGLDVGSVRPPLVDPSPSDMQRLAEIIAAGRAVLAAAEPAPQP